MTIFKSLTRGVAVSVLLAGVVAPAVGADVANAAPDPGAQSQSSTPATPTADTAAPDASQPADPPADQPGGTTAPPADTAPTAETETPATTPTTPEAPASTGAPTTTASPATVPADDPATQPTPPSLDGGSVTGESVTSMSGQQAIEALRAGAPLDLESMFPGQSVTLDQVIEMLAEDPTLHLVGDQLIYIEPRVPALPTIQSQDEVEVSAANVSNAFGLHSRPNSTKKIYLDFTGHVTTHWNEGQITRSAPYDTDGNPGSFSTREREQIARWWAQVAADFDTWDVDVTTQEPPSSYLSYSGPGDNTFGIRVVMTPSNFEGAAGVAGIGTFKWRTDKPAYVFTDRATNSSASYIHLAITHETGHTFGLRHDGIGSKEYYGGHSNWMPIMGGGDDRPIKQWSKGEYNGATNRQDDRQIIANVVGALPDDYGAAAAIGNNAYKYGIINSAGDTDQFVFDTAGGTVKVSAAPNRPSSELDLALTLRNAAGSVVGSSNSAGLGGETITKSVPAGRYTVTVDGVGARNPRTDGYSDYSSVGQYRVVAAYTPPKKVAAPIDDNGYRNIDFDGDGKTDVFSLAWTGRTYQWKYSSGGVRSWKNLASAGNPLNQLRFGDFDGDGKTDVFTAAWDGTRYQWKYSSGGVRGWKNLTRSTEPLEQLRFGDFNGDGKTDVFTATRNGSSYQWKYSSAAVAGWKNLTRSTEPLDQLRFGDFNGDRKTDVFAATWNGSSYQWKYSSAASAGWKNLTRSGVPISQLRFGDFNGDRRTDVFTITWTGRTYQWKYSSAGLAAWKNIAAAGNPLDQLRFGDFNGDRKTDVFTRGYYGGRWYWQNSSAGASGWIRMAQSGVALTDLRLS